MQGDDLRIPELDAALKSATRYRPWTDEELAIIRRYYKPGMVSPISRYLAKAYPPGRSISAISAQALKMGLGGQRG